MGNTVATNPDTSGPIYRAPVGTTAPTDATTQMSTMTAFKSIGNLSEDGYEEEIQRDSEVIKRWGGDSVLVIQTGKQDTFKFTAIDWLNVEMQKMTHGNDNVTGTLESGIKIESKAGDLESACYVIDEILTGGILQRTVIYEASVTAIGAVKHVGNDSLSKEITLTAVANNKGITYTRYIKKPAA